ncbi:hypothetical protein ACWGR4_24580 [Embleya sp. NPDC055664]
MPAHADLLVVERLLPAEVGLRLVDASPLPLGASVLHARRADTSRP